MNDIVRKVIGEKIKYYRNINDLTQNELALSVGLNRSSIANLELGKQNIGIDTLCKMASVLNIEPNILMPTLQELEMTPIIKKPDKYIKPYCSCGQELLHCSSSTVIDIRKIDDDGRIYKNRHEQMETNKDSYLWCKECKKNYSFTIDNKNRIFI